jgi:hypothetical protein
VYFQCLGVSQNPQPLQNILAERAHARSLEFVSCFHALLAT